MNLKLVNKIQETDGVFSFIFEPEAPISWIAGQFISLRIPHQNPDERGERGFYSISSAPFEKHIQITTRILTERGSTFKQSLSNLKIGALLETVKPSGDFTLTDPNKSCVFIAGGIGITPFRAILKQLDFENQPLNINLIYGNRDQNLIFKQELEKLVIKHPEFKLHPIIDPEKIGAGVVKRLVSDLKEQIFYVSGPEPMVEAFEVWMLEMGIPKDRIKQDFFPGYEWE